MNRIATIAAALLLSAAGVSAQTVPASALQLNCRSSAPLSSATDARVYYKCSDHKVYISKQGAAFTEFGAVPANMVTTDTTQTITADKTASGAWEFTKSIFLNGDISSFFYATDGTHYMSWDPSTDTLDLGTGTITATNMQVLNTLLNDWSIAGTAVTATALELNRSSGVTSPIQTQIDSKAPVSTTVTTDTPQTITATKTFQGADDQIHVDATTGNYGLIHFLDNGTDKFYAGLFPDSTWRIGTAGGSPFWVDFSTLAVRLYNLDLHPHDAPAANTKTFNLRNASDVSVASIDYEGDAIVHDLTLTGSLQSAIAESSVTNLTTDLAAKAPVGATYITQTADGTLTNEQALSALSTGIVKVTTTTGVLSTATAGTDYVAPSTTVNGKALSSNITLSLASADYANQGTATTLLHGNVSGNPSWGAVSLTADVSGVLPKANMASTVVHTDQANTYTNASQNFAAGTGTATYKPSGTITVSTTSTGNGADTTEDTGWTYTLPANTLDTNGQCVWMTAWGHTAANADGKTEKLYFGTTVVATTSGTQNNVQWRLGAYVCRTGSSAEIYVGDQLSNSTLTQSNSTSAQALGSNVTLKVTLQDTATSTANSTLVDGVIVRYLP